MKVVPINCLGSVRRGCVDLSRLDVITYCINCVDSASGASGTFAFDELLFTSGLGHFAIGPVFDSVDAFYAWAKDQGFLYYSLNKNFVMQRDYPKR